MSTAETKANLLSLICSLCCRRAYETIVNLETEAIYTHIHTVLTLKNDPGNRARKVRPFPISLEAESAISLTFTTIYKTRIYIFF